MIDAGIAIRCQQLQDATCAHHNEFNTQILWCGLSRISGMEWWNGTLEWNTEINNLMPNVALCYYCLMLLNILCYV